LNSKESIEQYLLESGQLVIKSSSLSTEIAQISEILIAAIKAGNKILWCGNGGSAADAQHLSAELSGRFYYDRPPLFSEALHVNTSYTTAVANDYSYDIIFSRLTQAMGRKGDVLIGLSTSGNSKNVIEAIKVANEIGMVTIGFTGETGGNMKSICKHLVNIPSKDTPRIQECHMILGHTICELVEIELFPKS
jgi:D-sedoheptulose 7-phosphate isomerase